MNNNKRMKINHSSTATPATGSNHHATIVEDFLYRRKVTYKRVPLKKIDFDREWARLRSLCGSKTSAKNAWETFQAAICKSYSTELQFQDGLFDALVEALGSDCCRMLNSTTTTSKAIQIKNRKWGFSTQVLVEKDAENDTSQSVRDSSISSDRSDHACVLFDESGKKAKDVMAIVELKMSDSCCGPIQTRDINGKANAEELDLGRKHGPIGQNIVYILDLVIPDLVRNNVQPKEIPVMVLAGKRKGMGDENAKKRRINDDKLSFVRGDVHIPERFGGGLEYSVSCFGDFKQYKEGIAAYINTLSFGAAAAEEACKHDISKPLAMLCSSEYKLLQSTIPECNLIASPISGDERFGPSPRLRVYQGELYEAVLSREFVKNVSAKAIWISKELHPVRSNMGEQAKVLIKVSSSAVHKILVMPFKTASAFKNLRGLKSKALSDVLIGVWSPNKGSLVTCMKDLTNEGYQNLKPCEIPDVSVLWNSFATLVHELMLPLACRSVVHCDIRSGWDHTANLMWKKTRDDMQLRLVDFESLCNVMLCSELPVDRRCFHVGSISDPDETTNAFAFLWWQCLLVANTWLKKTCSDKLDARKFVIDCHYGKLSAYFKGFLDEKDVIFLQEFAGSQMIMETMVMKTLQIFGEVFYRMAKRNTM